MAELPRHAEIVVIGGGIIGCSLAYHLARDHHADVILLERGKLTGGSTWHAAGLVGQLRTSASITQVLKYSVDLYTRLEAETGLATGWKQNGGLRLGCNDQRWIEIKRQATTARSFGLDMHLLTPGEARELWPLMETSDLVGAAFLPSDGQASPSDITASLAKGARMHGARIVEGVAVTGFAISDQRRIMGVTTTRGDIACEKAVICAGLWSGEVARMAGANVPLQPVQHQYMVSETIDGITSDLATLRDPDRLIYFKEEVGGLVMGGYEPNPMAWTPGAALPEQFEFQLLESNWEHFTPMTEQALARVPALEETGIKQLINGPESFTPDGNYIMGETPEVRGLFVGCGFNAFGIAAGGGAGWTLADWVVRGEQPLDLWVVDVRRFSSLHHDRDWVRERTLEAYAKHYTIAFPHEEYESARRVIVSALYDRLADRGACFGAKLGWERPNWFAPEGVTPRDDYSMGRQNWFEPVGAEHRACREAVALFDQSSFAKFELCGPGAEAALSRIAANNVARPPGRLVYTQMLNTRGGIACDLTAARLADNRYYIVTGTGFRTHDFAWIRDHIPPGAEAELIDVTERYGTLSLFGPRAREVLQTVTGSDLSHAAFPFAHVREIALAGQKVLALRVTYVGELGWELHIPIAAIAIVFDALMEAGEPFGLRLAGYRAIESLRLEKGYRAWGADITPNDTPFEAGLGWAVKLGSNIDFVGRDAAEKAAGRPLAKKLACFTVDDPMVTLVGRETILRNGRSAGYLTSAGYGYTIAKPIGYGYVRRPDKGRGVTDNYLRKAKYELVVAGELVPAKLHLEALYDPKMERIKC